MLLCTLSLASIQWIAMQNTQKNMHLTPALLHGRTFEMLNIQVTLRGFAWTLRNVILQGSGSGIGSSRTNQHA